MAKKVAIFGGGMAGLAAAHELSHRGFSVTVYERGDAIGGKSASQGTTGGPAPAAGLAPLPGEHGFRFFPGFYRNVIATLDEIPRPNGGVVGEDLVPSANAGITWKGQLHSFPRRSALPSNDVIGRMKELVGGLGFTPTDFARMCWFRIKYLTSGAKRRRSHDAITWWDYIDGNSPHYSAGFREFERSIPRTMSAMIAEQSSAKVIGDITLQFLLGYGRPDNEEDRLFVGPTTRRWLEPWRADLASRAVAFELGAELERFTTASATSGGKITGAVVRKGAQIQTVTADFYVAALPLEGMQAVLAKSPPLASADPALAKLMAAPASTAWMVGAQLYLRKDEPMVDGHVFYPRSPWALTSVSQGQFWAKSGKPIEQTFGDGTVRGILSVIISDWDTPDVRSGLPARRFANAKSLLEEVRLQLVDEIGGAADLSTANVAHAHLDSNLKLGLGPPDYASNESPLLVHPKGGLDFRPAAHGAIENLYLCADYVQTSTMLATMESANEAARRAVNAILDSDASAHVRCPVWELQEEPIFTPVKQLDDLRFAEGRPHLMDELPAALSKSPGLLDLLQQTLTSSAPLLSALF